jgi:hypothetical protein
MVVPVAVVDHVFPEAALDVNTTEPPEQKVVALPAEITGVAGKGFTITVIGVLALSFAALFVWLT